MSSSWLKQNSGSSHPSVAFEEIGAKIVGRIVEEPRVVETDNDGKKQESLVVPVEALAGTAIRAGKAGERQAVQPGDVVSVWIKAGAFATAVQKALTAAGAQGLEEGGTLAVQFIGEGERKPGKSAPKLYAAEYSRAVAAVGLGSLIPGNTGL